MGPILSKDKYLLRSIAIIISMCFSFLASEAQVTDSLKIYFRSGSSQYDPSYKGNAERMDNFIKRIDEIERDSVNYTIYKIEYSAAASLEGSVSFNRYISQKRFESIVGYINNKVRVSEELIVSTVLGEDWGALLEMIADVEFKNKDKVLEIVMDNNLSHADKELQIKQIDNRKTWEYLLKTFYPEMRYCEAVVYVGEAPVRKAWADQDPLSVEYFAPISAGAHFNDTLSSSIQHNLEHTPLKYTTWSIKTNTVALGMLIANAGAEVKFGQFSFALPIMFSAIDYFAADTKFRVLSFQPEFRWWIPKTKGLFIGAHFGLGWYNIAANGNWRYQDHDGDCPSIGGGLGIGYKLPINKSGRLNLEFELGAGVYSVNYDTFYNEPNGPLANTTKKTYIGLDNVAISLVYDFRVLKKNRK